MQQKCGETGKIYFLASYLYFGKLNIKITSWKRIYIKIHLRELWDKGLIDERSL